MARTSWYDMISIKTLLRYDIAIYRNISQYCDILRYSVQLTLKKNDDVYVNHTSPKIERPQENIIVYSILACSVQQNPYYKV